MIQDKSPIVYRPDYARSTAPLVRVEAPAHPTPARMSRNAGVYLVCILSVLIYFFSGMPVLALVLPAAYGILLAATRQYEGTTDTTYRVFGLKLRGDTALDQYTQRRRWQVEKKRGGVVRAWQIMSPEGRRVAWGLMTADEQAIVMAAVLVEWRKERR